MAPGVPTTRRFVNHPGAKDAPAHALKYEPKVDENPVLRGLPLVVASALITSSAWVRKFMWANARFGQARLEPGLENEVWRLQPDVLPLADGPSSQRMLELEDELRRPQPDDLPGRFMSVADYHGLYSRGEATPLDVVEALLPLIRRDVTPRSPYSVAWLQTDVEAVLAAARASTDRWAANQPLGILDGVPFGVKDDIPVKGFVSTMAIPHQASEPYFQTPETETAWPVLKMQEAGAILLGKMNQHEIGMDTTGCNCGTGTPQNWYSPSHYPGGSSSGGGSALCAGTVPIAVGTDAGGSCRIPPAFCGVYGLKGTHHRTGTMKSSVCVMAPMAATAADLAIAYRHMAQPNPSDPHQSLFAASLPPSPSQKKYLGLCRPWLARASPSVLAVFESTISRLVATHGYETIDISLPYLETGQYAHAATCLAESVDHARARVPPGTGNYARMLSHPNRILLSVGAETSAVDYLRYGQVRQVIMAHLAALWERYPGMVVVTPTTPDAGWPVVKGDEVYGLQDGGRAMRNMTYVWLANWVGCPAVSCPAGYVEVEGKGGEVLPVGVMAMGEWGEEERLLGWAREVEGGLERRRPEEWVDVGGLVRGEMVVGGDEGELTRRRAGEKKELRV